MLAWAIQTRYEYSHLMKLKFGVIFRPQCSKIQGIVQAAVRFLATRINNGPIQFISRCVFDQSVKRPCLLAYFAIQYFTGWKIPQTEIFISLNISPQINMLRYEEYTPYNDGAIMIWYVVQNIGCNNKKQLYVIPCMCYCPVTFHAFKIFLI